MYVGIDPGLTGAVASIGEEGEVLSLMDTPSFLLNGKRRDYNTPEMVALFVTALDWGGTGAIQPHVFIERQQSRPEQGVVSVFKIGYGYGLWMGMLAFTRTPHTVVSPQVWQHEMYQGAVGEGKERSLLIASRLWPNLKIGRHDRADALLIAEYGRRVLQGQVRSYEEVSR